MPEATLEQRMTTLEQTVRELQEAINARTGFGLAGPRDRLHEG